MCIHLKSENFKNSILMQYLYNNNEVKSKNDCEKKAIKKVVVKTP